MDGSPKRHSSGKRLFRDVIAGCVVQTLHIHVVCHAIDRASFQSGNPRIGGKSRVDMGSGVGSLAGVSRGCALDSGWRLYMWFGFTLVRRQRA
ncbi:MAG: hypothetical protein FWD57_12135 [Polyangiaceae bacterium]|nr:hypothetical protein [Polyangiaceae bacterium]